MKQTLRSLLLSAAITSLACVQAHASPTGILYFNWTPGTGAITYAGGNSPLVGSGIVIDSTSVSISPPASPPLAQTLAITNGTLSFSTGPWSTSCASGCVFNGGGVITFTGGISGLGIAIPDGTVLLSGSTTYGNVYDNGVDKGLILDYQVTFIDPRLASEFGLQGIFQSTAEGFLRFHLQSGISLPPEAFSSSIPDAFGGVLNPVAVVPEPATMTLIASGAAALFLRRRVRGEKYKQRNC